MKSLFVIVVALICLVQLVSCGSISQVPPPVTAGMTKKPKNSRDSAARQTNLGQLHSGRTLFVSRCIECHTLPPVWHYTNQEWPHLVDTMAHRAHLKPDEREAVVAYILAARAQ